MPEKNDWLKTTGAVLGAIAIVITLLVILLINPVKETAVEAKERADKNRDDIADIKESQAVIIEKVDGIADDVKEIKKEVK
jgi:uncharacterized protein YoxC